MAIVGKDGSILEIEWDYMGHHYHIVSTQSTGSRLSVWDAIDEVKRDDGMVKKFTRKELKQYFK